MRKQYKGVVAVQRKGAGSPVLEAFVKLEDGRSFYYDRAPKCFFNIVTGQHNQVAVEFEADEEGRRPTKAKAIGTPY